MAALLRTHVVFASQDRHCIYQAEQVNLSVAGNISVTDKFSIAGFNFSFVALLCCVLKSANPTIQSKFFLPDLFERNPI